MYEPQFNTVVVEIDDADAKWGNGNDDSMLGKSYSKGTLIKFGYLAPTSNYPIEVVEGLAEQLVRELDMMVGKQIMWNQGTEAGTLFEHDGKQYGFIYWWDIRAKKDD